MPFLGRIKHKWANLQKIIESDPVAWQDWQPWDNGAPGFSM
jgi:hypothetical protein